MPGVSKAQETSILETQKREESEIRASISKHLREQKEKANVCNECGAAFDEDAVSNGYLVCRECGLVKDVHIDFQAEWRCFNTSSGGKDLSGVRCGDPTSNLTPGAQLNTYIGGKDKRLQRVHQWNNMSPQERKMHEIFKEFDQIGQSHSLSRPLVSAATDLYNKLYTEMENQNCGVKRCNVRQGLKAACLYFACKQMNTPREKKEIAIMVDTTTKIVTKGCNFFLDIMGEQYIHMEPFRPEDFVTRFSLLLGISYPSQLKLKKIVEYAADLSELTDVTPTCVTAACVYFLSHIYEMDFSKEDICDKCSVSQTILTKTYNVLLAHKDQIKNIVEKSE